MASLQERPDVPILIERYLLKLLAQVFLHESSGDCFLR